jgi:hypothetical protein
MEKIARAQVRRSLDRFQRRKPLRLSITRRIARSRAGAEEFVTEVEFGDVAALFAPWGAGRRPQPTGS